MNKIRAFAVTALLASLTACSAPTYDTYEDAAWAGAICTSQHYPTEKESCHAVPEELPR